RVDVGDEQQHAGKPLAARDDAEFGGLLDRVGGVAAGIGKADNLGLRALCLQQEGREVRVVERMLDAAEHLAAIRGDDRRSVALERLAERIVRGEEEPGVAAGFHQRLAGAVGEHVGVVDPVHRVRRALRAREVGRGGARVQIDDVLVLGEVGDREADIGGCEIDEHVDLLDVDPLLADVDGDIGLVLVVGRDQVDLPAFRQQPGVL
ncbi:hypothetical protein chiPu_0031890, partial [Chiloscyllium punctatum]|nr:hypothetical protein [Chiloscyllium punctatum]